MCPRITMTYPDEAMAQLFGAVWGNDLPEGPRFNICPTNPVAVVTSDVTSGGGRRLRSMRWGFVPSWYKAVNDGPLILNARSETVAEKSAFREAVRQRRCIVPATGFYEWSAGPGSTRLPWYFTRTDGAPLALAGLWSRWGDMDTVAIVTGPSGANMVDIHDREPVVLEAVMAGRGGGHGAAVLMRASPGGCVAVTPGVGGCGERGTGLGGAGDRAFNPVDAVYDFDRIAGWVAEAEAGNRAWGG